MYGVNDHPLLYFTVIVMFYNKQVVLDTGPLKASMLNIQNIWIVRSRTWMSTPKQLKLPFSFTFILMNRGLKKAQFI